MFCNQCEQSAQNGCTGKAGVCGKNEDINSLQDILLYGVKGISAYAFHLRQLGIADEEIDGFVHEALFSTLTNTDFDAGRFLELILRAGRINIKVMELLDRAHRERFGDSVPVDVPTGSFEGRGILVTGHDLLDLYELLKQTEGKGINIYTHGEMLPAHGYPELKKFKHLAANWGGAWHKQRSEFEAFPGAILATTNCVLMPKDSYKDRLFTCGIAGIEGAIHIKERDFSPLIKRALEMPSLQYKKGSILTTGFKHTNVLALAGKIVEAVKAGKISHFFLIGGCDAPGEDGNYYRAFAESAPKDSVILTLACGKFRINDIDFGDIDGIPRLIDLGQCNDAYSAIKIAGALAEAFKTDVNGLPLTLILSWFEQKAVAILLSLLYLDIKGMRIGPKPPAFITNGVLEILQDKFDLKLTGEPNLDLDESLAKNEPAPVKVSY
ncbi:MAG: hydroxylamine reductase [Candidatus Omnitrophica bacterium CG1_02_49_10]|nr:MAG: hydroxylamine reductase [Candidatus Omnitrophica bacterium CG1_02_49_10]